MSVINKMLRDLDQRQGGGVASKTTPGSRATSGTVPLGALPATAHPALWQRLLAWGGGLLLAAAAAFVAGVWYLPSNQQVSAPTVAVAVATPAAVITAPVVVLAPAPEPPPPPLVTAPVVALPPPLPSTAQAAPKKQALIAAAPPAKAKAPPARAPVTEPTDTSQRPDKALAKAPAASSATATPATGVLAAPDALAKAQALWNAGSRLAATDLLQQTLNQFEAAGAPAGPVTGQSTLARLARELARMHMAEGQVRQALALLTRLEPQLFQVADIWAMRGNAEQRLGQHAAAVKNYRQALRLKPDEPRWMMGQAVSLAAQGQISEAGELAEMARVSGALRPEVANYLRQLGVTVRAD